MAYFNWNNSKISKIPSFSLPTRGGGISWIEVADRDSEIQLQVGENLNYLIWVNTEEPQVQTI